MASERLFLTAPMAFHSDCRPLSSPATVSQSVESISDSAFSHSASFFFRFSPQSCSRAARCSCQRVKN